MKNSPLEKHPAKTSPTLKCILTLKLKITQFFYLFQINNPQLPHRERIRTNYVNLVFITRAYSSHQVSSRYLHSKHFPRFPVSKISISPLQPSMSPDLITFENEVWDIRFFYISSFIEIQSPIRKIPRIHVFQEFRLPPPTPFNVTWSGRDLNWEF